MKKLILLITISIIAVACTGTKKMYKKAVAFEQQGMYAEAASYYLNALHRKSTNVEAAIGLKRTGQLVLDDYLADYFKVHTAKQFKEAVYAYKKAEDYQKAAKRYSVQLEMPSYYVDYYNEDLDYYLASLYDKAMSHLDKEDFDASAKVLDEILNLKPDYKDVAELKTFARLEPIYRKANTALEEKKYRKAYYLFEKTISYKDSDELKAHALKEGQYPIAMLAFENATTVENLHKAFESQFLNLFIKNKNPFIKIIDRVHIETIIAEQELGLSGMVDAQTAAQAGDLFGAKALLVGRLVSIDMQKAKLKPQRKKGWESYKKKHYNPSTKKYDTVTKYKKVYYTEYKGENSVKLSVEYKLISTETGEILATDLISTTKDHSVWYASYDGNKNKLMPGDWASKDKDSSEDVRYDGYQDKKHLSNLLKASRNLKSVEELKTAALKFVSNKAVADINAYNPEEN